MFGVLSISHYHLKLKHIPLGSSSENHFSRDVTSSFYKTPGGAELQDYSILSKHR